MLTQRSSKVYLKEGSYIIDKQDPSLSLGKGSFGEVYKGYDTIYKREVAIKQINIEFIEQFDEQMKQVILNEINVMRKFSKKMQQIPCQYLVQLYDCFRSNNYLYIVMEFCHHGTLFDQLKTKHNGFTQQETIQIAKQLLQALQYLQNLNIAHRDLKPQNIFVSQSQNAQKTKIYKIGDFGFAAKKETFNDILGTYPYMAPQIFQRQQYTAKVDVWSLGITLHQLLFKQLFYLDKNKWQIQQIIKQKDYKLSEKQRGKISKRMYNFLKLCLTKNKFQRPSASELIGHQLFNQQSQDNRWNIFGFLRSVIERCEKLLKMSMLFAQYQIQTQHKTIFIQLYLLKFALCEMNRVSYSVQNKQNYINIPTQQFQELMIEKNQAQYKQLNQLSSKIRAEVVTAFTEKFQIFQSSILPKFKPKDQQLIQKTINNQPYEEPIYDIFVNELKKWAYIINNSKSTPQFIPLKQQCQQIITAYQENS